MTQKLLLIALTALINAFLLSEVQSTVDNSSLFLYGTINTIDGDEYKGQIRWGKEEAFWFDFFNSSKPENDNLSHLSRAELKALNDKSNWVKRTGWMSWSSQNDDHTHSFACQFGDIKRIVPKRGSRLMVMFKNGETLKLSGGSNDVGATVRIYDEEMGLLKLDWDNIAEINFEQAPRGFVSAFGAPLYGTVNTTAGSFTGYVQWDHDERLSDDELNGDTNGGELDIPFEKIRNIEKTRRGSMVKMHSGRSFELTGSNDVDDDNRGIIVNIEGMGRVDIPWDEFIEVTFMDNPTAVRASYDSEKITGTVETANGKRYSGQVIFDLDETYQLEILNGDDEGLEYLLPFRYVSSIKPKNDRATLITLKNGEKLLLEDSVDVTDDNDGVLIQTDDENYTYVPWEDVDEIKLY